MATTAKLMTAEQFMRIPDDGYRYELVRGELRKMAAASFDHGVYASRIVETLLPFVRGNRLGEVPLTEPGFLLGTDPDHVRIPDVCFVRQERIDAAERPFVFFSGAPDLVVEVISPNDRYTDVDDKVGEWLEGGAGMVIVVNPRNRTVRVHSPAALRQAQETELTEADTLDGGDVVAGWSMPVADIFS